MFKLQGGRDRVASSKTTFANLNKVIVKWSADAQNSCRNRVINVFGN